MIRAAAALVLGALSALGASAAAQTPEVAVEPDTVTVGDVFRVAVRVDLPSGMTARFADTLDVVGDVENAEPMNRVDGTRPDGGAHATAVYRLSAWRPGTIALPDVAVGLAEPDGTARTVIARLPTVHVRSVLPADTAGLEARAPKSVVGPDRRLWPWLVILALLSAGVGGAGLYVARRIRQGGGMTAVPAGPPRERALAALERARPVAPVDGRAVQAFYALVADVLREYLAAIDPAFGRELTTSELLVRTRERMDARRTDPLAELLNEADRVKFAGARPRAAEAEALWDAAYRWVEVEPAVAAADGDVRASDDERDRRTVGAV